MSKHARENSPPGISTKYRQQRRLQITESICSEPRSVLFQRQIDTASKTTPIARKDPLLRPVPIANINT